MDGIFFRCSPKILIAKNLWVGIGYKPRQNLETQGLTAKIFGNKDLAWRLIGLKLSKNPENCPNQQVIISRGEFGVCDGHHGVV